MTTNTITGTRITTAPTAPTPTPTTIRTQEVQAIMPMLWTMTIIQMTIARLKTPLRSSVASLEVAAAAAKVAAIAIVVAIIVDLLEIVQ